MELETLLEQVTDRASFLTFVAALIADREDSIGKEKLNPSSPFSAQANGWENVTIETFLDAALAWGEGKQMGRTYGLSEEPSWKEFAYFLYCGKVYE